MAGEQNETVGRIEAELAAVEHALERLRLGTYRQCEACGAPLDPAELEADPLRRHCAAHRS